ncbi:MAG TPA: 50S ribosomal protein L6, partial [Bacteroidetes bacterium]|nr:50S ribosomal protein L6 [Bacteroidota bacterium]
MSRIGRKPVPIAKGVTISAKDGVIQVKGPKGELSAALHPSIGVKIDQSEVVVTRSSDEKNVRALHGLWRALINNMVNGVTQGYSRKLEIVGVGYRAEMKGNKVQVQIGYSHP